MTETQTPQWEAAAHLRSEEDITAYLDAALMVAMDDPGFIVYVLEVIDRARDMAQSDRTKSDTIPPMEGWQSG